MSIMFSDGQQQKEPPLQLLNSKTLKKSQLSTAILCSSGKPNAAASFTS